MLLIVSVPVILVVLIILALLHKYLPARRLRVVHRPGISRPYEIEALKLFGWRMIGQKRTMEEAEEFIVNFKAGKIVQRGEGRDAGVVLFEL